MCCSTVISFTKIQIQEVRAETIKYVLKKYKTFQAYNQILL